MVMKGFNVKVFNRIGTHIVSIAYNQNIPIKDIYQSISNKIFYFLTPLPITSPPVPFLYSFGSDLFL